jgi:hypothetical protein
MQRAGTLTLIQSFAMLGSHRAHLPSGQVLAWGVNSGNLNRVDSDRAVRCYSKSAVYSRQVPNDHTPGSVASSDSYVDDFVAARSTLAQPGSTTFDKVKPEAS